MKKIKAMIVASAMLMALTACGEEKTETAPAETSADTTVTAEETTSAEITEEAASETEAAEETTLEVSEEGEEAVTTFTCDDSSSVLSFMVDEDGKFSFTHSGEDDVSWSIYLMSEEFDDGYRYLYSNYEPYAESNCTISISGGTYVYCICSENEWNSENLPESTLVVANVTE